MTKSQHNPIIPFVTILFKKVNCWLNDLARNLNWDLELRSYIFRHTAITLAADGGLNTSYISMLTGSNPKCIQDNYYNGMNDKTTHENCIKFLKMQWCCESVHCIV